MKALIIKFLIFCSVSLFLSCEPGKTLNGSEPEEYTGTELSELKARLSKGWNTWNTRSVLSHVLLPECFAVKMKQIHGMKNNTGCGKDYDQHSVKYFKIS